MVPVLTTLRTASGGAEAEDAVDDRAYDARGGDHRELRILGLAHGTARAATGSGRRSFCLRPKERETQGIGHELGVG